MGFVELLARGRRLFMATDEGAKKSWATLVHAHGVVGALLGPRGRKQLADGKGLARALTGARQCTLTYARWLCWIKAWLTNVIKKDGVSRVECTGVAAAAALEGGATAPSASQPSPQQPDAWLDAASASVVDGDAAGENVVDGWDGAEHACSHLSWGLGRLCPVTRLQTHGVVGHPGLLALVDAPFVARSPLKDASHSDEVKAMSEALVTAAKDAALADGGMDRAERARRQAVPVVVIVATCVVPPLHAPLHHQPHAPSPLHPLCTTGSTHPPLSLWVKGQR